MDQTRRERDFRHRGVIRVHEGQLLGRARDVRAVPPEPVNREVNRFDLVILAQQLDGHDHGLHGFEAHDAHRFHRVADFARQAEARGIDDLQKLRHHRHVLGDDFSHLLGRGVGRFQRGKHLQVKRGNRGEGADARNQFAHAVAGDPNVQGEGALDVVLEGGRVAGFAEKLMGAQHVFHHALAVGVRRQDEAKRLGGFLADVVQ